MLSKDKIIITSNLIPLVGAIFFGWEPKGIIWGYWAETVIISVFSIIKIRKAKGKKSSYTEAQLRHSMYVPQTKLELIRKAKKRYLWIVGIYGFVFFILFFPSLKMMYVILIMSISSFVEHAISYYTEFIKNEKYKNIFPFDQYQKPLSRILVMHGTVIFSVGIVSFGFFKVILAVLIFIKIWVELVSEGCEKYIPSSMKYRI
jgi:hypothetical protein